MIDIEKAKQAFEEYLKDYDVNDGKIKLKVTHTYHVVDYSEYIAKELKLSEEFIDLAKLIALLHDIGRFEQLKLFDDYKDERTMDHAEYGYMILFEQGLIRKFIDDDKYDNIIAHAIRNHSKYTLTNDFSEDELLHCKIIRDADKLDNFRVKETEKFEDIGRISEEGLSNGLISDEVYEEMINRKQVLKSKIKTELDFWVSIVSFTFDINFKCSFKYLKETNYINIVIDRIDYKNQETKRRVEEIRKATNNYIDEQL